MRANTACTRRVGLAAFSSRLRGLRLVLAKWLSLVPPTRPLRGCFATGNAHRWAADSIEQLVK